MTGASVPSPNGDDETVVRGSYETARNLRAQFVDMLDGDDFAAVVAGIRQAFTTLHQVDHMAAQINAARPVDLAPIPLIGEDHLTATFLRAGLTLGFVPPSDGSLN